MLRPDPKPQRTPKKEPKPFWSYRTPLIRKVRKGASKRTDKQRAKARADKWFAEFIRLRDLGRPCCTCGNPIGWYRNQEGKIIINGDCGHFITRDNEHVRYNEKNCNLQCKSCNRMKSGKQYEHGIYIDNRWGKGTANNILVVSKWPPSKRDTYSYSVIADEYRGKANQLRKKL